MRRSTPQRPRLARPQAWPQPRAQVKGFGLAELMLSLGLGLVVCAALLQSLLLESRSGERLVRRLQQRRLQQQALALVAADLRQATQLSRTPAAEQPDCNLGGRVAVLHLHSAAGAITYSVGAAPSNLWRGPVLMRCGPAYGLEGELSPGSASQNRVVLDGLASSAGPWPDCPSDGVILGPSLQLGFAACLSGDGTSLALRLQQAADQQAPGPSSTALLEWSGNPAVPLQPATTSPADPAMAVAPSATTPTDATPRL